MIKNVYLENGICVVGEENSFVRSISIGIWIKNGSVDETAHNNGISHFIEHMYFKGTEKRTAKDIADEMAAIGGRVNAFTSKEYMCYYAHVLSEHFDSALEILSDMLCHSVFDKTDMEKEKSVIIEEINMNEDSPEDVLNDSIENEVWNGSAIGRNILGTINNVEKFSRDEILHYKNQHYIGGNIVISVVGNMNFERVTQKLQEAFKKIERKEPQRRDDIVDYKQSFITREKDIEQTHFCLSFPTISYLSEETYVLSTLNTIIGAGFNSRLFQSIREARGLAYSIYSYPETYKHGGIYNIYVATNPTMLEKVAIALMEELDKLIKIGFNKNELIRTKEQMKSGLIIGLESMNSRMSNYGKSKLILNKVREQDEITNKINAVSIGNLTEFANNLIDYSKMSVGIVGKLKEINVERIKEICRN